MRNDNWSRTQLQLNLYHDDTRLIPLINVPPGGNVPSYVETQPLATTKKSRKWFQKSVCGLPALSRRLNKWGIYHTVIAYFVTRNHPD